MRYSFGNILCFRWRACQCWLNPTPVFRRNSVRYTCGFKSCLFGTLWIVFWRHHAHVKLEMPFLSLYLLVLFLQCIRQTLGDKNPVLYLLTLQCLSCCSIPVQSKRNICCEWEIPQRNSFRDLTCGNSHPCSDFSLAPRCLMATPGLSAGPRKASAALLEPCAPL